MTLKDMALLVNALEVNGMGGLYPIYPRVQTGNSGNTRKFCSYHQTTSHNSDECTQKLKISTTAPIIQPSHSQNQTPAINQNEPNRRAYRVALPESSPDNMPILVNGAQLWGIPDFGADVSLISEKTAKYAKVLQLPGQLDIQLAIPGHGVTLNRYCEATIQKDNVIHAAKLWIVPEAEFHVLLGTDVLPHLGVSISGLSLSFSLTSKSFPTKPPDLILQHQSSPPLVDPHLETNGKVGKKVDLSESSKPLQEKKICAFNNPNSLVRIQTTPRSEEWIRSDKEMQNRLRSFITASKTEPDIVILNSRYRSYKSDLRPC